MTVSMIKTNEDLDFPWEVGVKKNGVLVFFDYFTNRPDMTTLFKLISEAEITL